MKTTCTEKSGIKKFKRFIVSVEKCNSIKGGFDDANAAVTSDVTF